MSDISPSWPSNANLALYIGFSGSGGGGGAAARGGGGGARGTVELAAETDTLVTGAGAGVELITGFCAANGVDWPGRGRAVGFGRDAAAEGFEGPPARRSFPCVIGRTTPGFLLAGGRETLLGGSPEGTRTVWLLYTSSLGTVSSLMNLIPAFLSFFFAYSTVGPIRTLIEAWVSCNKWVANSVLKSQLMTGSPSSDGTLVFRTIQSSLRFDMLIVFIVTSGILRSNAITGAPSLGVVMRI